MEGDNKAIGGLIASGSSKAPRPWISYLTPLNLSFVLVYRMRLVKDPFLS